MDYYADRNLEHDDDMKLALHSPHMSSRFQHRLHAGRHDGCNVASSHESVGDWCSNSGGRRAVPAVRTMSYTAALPFSFLASCLFEPVHGELQIRPEHNHEMTVATTLNVGRCQR